MMVRICSEEGAIKITGNAAARYYPERRAVALFFFGEDIPNIEKLFVYKQRRDEKDGGDAGIDFELEVKARAKTFKQHNAIWALLQIMFVSMNGYKPTKDELYDLYLDVLDLYANKTKNRFTGALRPIHLSESNVEDAAALIGHIMSVMAEYCDLSLDEQSDVQKIFKAWEGWRGDMVRDPMDYDEDGNLLTVAAWEARHQISQASGIGGILQTAHIVSRGANVNLIEDVRNLLRLTPEEHRFQHGHGWDAFLERYPHLKSRALHARQLVGP